MAVSQAAPQIADPGDDAHPRLEMPSPLALFGGLGSRLSLVAHMTEQGPGRWDEREFPDGPLLLSPKPTHRKITPRSPTSCLSRFQPWPRSRPPPAISRQARLLL